MVTKYCSRCRALKPIGDFNKNRARKDGLAYWCKPCAREYQNLYVAEDRRDMGKVWESAYRRRCRELGMPPVVAPFSKEEVVCRYDWACVLCGATGEISIDHRVPVAMGGEHSIQNCRPLCETCHRRKSAEDMRAIVRYRRRASVNS